MTGQNDFQAPETIAALQGRSRVRIPPSMDVPLTARVRRIIDTPPMRRLASLSQLGLVALVYPGATHTRQEHSLGVYRAAIDLLHHLGDWRREAHWLDGPIDHRRGDDAFLLASLVHDAGHWPFCHPIEDMGRSCPIKHEQRVENLLRQGPLADAVQEDWCCNSDDIMAVLCPETWDQRTSNGQCGLSRAETLFWASCLSGPIDIDKLDYLQRDSLHAGVPYGSHFDPARLTAAFRPHPDEPRLAINTKGRTAAEMMVFGRYVMFSEVYWHSAVRSATAMLQRALFEMSERPRDAKSFKISPATSRQPTVDWTQWVDYGDAGWIDAFRQAAGQFDGETNTSGPVIRRMVEGLFGTSRNLYKRVAEFNVESRPDLHSRLARRPYWWLVQCSYPLAECFGKFLGQPVDPAEVLIDAPPVKLEVDINIDIVDASCRVGSLGDVSPVASVLADRQFDNHVKRVRVFVPDTLRQRLRSIDNWSEDLVAEWLDGCVDQMESQWA